MAPQESPTLTAPLSAARKLGNPCFEQVGAAWCSVLKLGAFSQTQTWDLCQEGPWA